MADRLSRTQRLDIIAELCPRFGTRRACDSFERARDRAVEIIGAPDRAEMTADYLLMRAVDLFAGGEISLEELYRCRVLAYYMLFASGGEEWARWGVATSVRPGEFPEEASPPEHDDSLSIPPGPPWRPASG